MTKPGDTLMNAAAALSIRVIHRSLNGGGGDCDGPLPRVRVNKTSDVAKSGWNRQIGLTVFRKQYAIW